MTDLNHDILQPSLLSIETRYGELFIPEGNDLIAGSLQEYGEWAQAELDIICDFIPPGSTVIDGGACFGTHSRAFSMKTGPSGRVISFEPAHANWAILARNAANAKVQNIDIRPFALGAKEGMAHTRNDEGNNVGGTRIEIIEANGNVKIVRLDDEVETTVHFIKLDLEGLELSALIGARRILSTDRPVVFTEILNLESGAPLLKYMSELGYFCYGINTPAFKADNFRGSSIDIFHGGTECGLLFLHDEKSRTFSDIIEIHALPQVSTLDDLVILLMQQPQYIRQTLVNQKAAHQLPMPMGRLEADRLSSELIKSREALTAKSAELAHSHEAFATKSKELAQTQEAFAAKSVELVRTQDTLTTKSEELAKTREGLAAKSAKLARTQEALIAKSADLAQTQEGLAAKSAELVRTQEILTAQSSKLGQTQEALASYADKLMSDLDELADLLERWQAQNSDLLRLAKRVRAFPFGLYFRLKTRHRRSTRQLLRFPDQPAYATERSSSLRELLNSLIEELHTNKISVSELNPPSRVITQQDSYRGKVIQAISSVSQTALLAPFPEDIEPVLDADTLISELKLCGDKVVISISHDDYRSITGGTQMCIQIEAASAAPSEMDYLNIHPVRTCNALLPENEIQTSLFRLVINGQSLGIARYDDILAAITRQKEMSQSFHFVVHHLLGHAPEVVAKLIETGGDGQCYFWLHDFFAACRSYTLRRNNLEYCGGPEVASQGCRICTYGHSRLEHTERFRAFFDRIEVTALAPSRIAAETWSKVCAYKLHEMIVQPHAALVSTPRSEPLQPLGQKDTTHKRIAFIGVATDHKGWPTFMKLVSAKLADTDLEFHYFGKSDVPDNIIKHHVDALASKSPNAMSRALSAVGIDIVIHMAPWPETFSLTTVEALASYAYVITHSGSGNVADLVRETGRGKVLENEAELLEWIESEDFESLVREARKKRRLETLSLRYSDMSINKIRASVSK